MKKLFLAPILIAALLAANSTVALADRIQLSPSQVRQIFIGKPWHSPSGAFFFSTNGTYTYKPHRPSKSIGWLKYRVLGDGTLDGPKTSYTFYKNGSGYQYYHSKSKRFISAWPNKKLQQFMTEE